MKIERKYMAHYLNATFAADDGTASYVRLGKDLEEYSPELSANVEKKTNILGNETVSIDSYQKQGEVSPYYAEKGDPLFEKLQSIIDNDLVLDDLKTDIVEVKLWDAQSSGAFPAVREECYIEVSSYGGDTTGYQIPFNVHYTGVKTKGTFNPIKAHVLEECDPLSAEVSINTLNLTLFNQEGRFSILNPEGYFDVLQHRQKLTVWEDVRRSAHDTSTTSYCMGTFYLDDWSNEDDTLADFTAIDTIGLLDGSPFDGGVYDTHVASLAAEILSGYPYTLDSVLGEERIQGYIPAGTRREALQQLAFAIGAVVDCSRGEIIRIVPAPQRASGLIGTDRRLQDGSKVTLLALVTAVSVTAHRYIPGEASEELYKDTLEPGTYRVTFDAPAVADSLAVRGAELSERGVNHCTLTVSKAAEVCVTGRKYSDSATVLRREASNLPSNAQGNEVSVPDATLVSPDRAAAVAARVLDYYAQRYEQTFRMVAGDEKLADRLIVESFGGEMVRGVVTKLEFDLTGGFLADAKIVGRKLSNNAAAYAGEEIHAGERSFI